MANEVEVKKSKPSKATTPRVVKPTVLGKKLKGDGPKWPSFMKGLRASGFNEEQTLGIATNLQKHIFTEIATKIDVHDMGNYMNIILQAEAAHSRAKFETEATQTRAKFETEATQTRAKFEAEANQTRAKLESEAAQTRAKSEAAASAHSKDISELRTAIVELKTKDIFDVKINIVELKTRIGHLEVSFNDFKKEVERRFKTSEENSDRRFKTSEENSDRRFKSFEKSIDERMSAMEARLKAEIDKAVNKAIYKFAVLLGGFGSAIYAIEKILM